jgi:hypothetical protein
MINMINMINILSLICFAQNGLFITSYLGLRLQCKISERNSFSQNTLTIVCIYRLGNNVLDVTVTYNI